MRLSRAGFLGGMTAGTLTSSLPSLAYAELQRVRAPLVPVLADSSRVIRTVVGLRPYRREGFALSAGRFGAKTLVHNYGHGGGGISLSWGVATLAADLVAGSGARSAAVIGCGVIGLSTARVLQDRGFAVTIYSEALPPYTTSNVAGGQWTPTSVFSDAEATPAFLETFERAALIANRRFQVMAGSKYGIRWIENYELMRDTSFEGIRARARRQHFDFYADEADVDPQSTPFDFPLVQRFTTMLIEPNIYLPAMLDDYFVRGGKIVVRRFAAARELMSLNEPVIFNCTGLGAHGLFNDQTLYPVRGQLTLLEPQPEVNYIVIAPGIYMFPRTDGIVVGGTFQPHVWSTEPDLAVQTQKLQALADAYRK